MNERSIKINVPVLARVEGEGALDLHIEGDAIQDLKLRIYEPPRYFEKFLEGRSYRDVPDTVARICGICPVAYQMSAVHAIESIFAVTATPWVRNMRRLLYCGEWLQSHSLHIHMLAAPDFLGYNSILEMASEHADIVRRGLLLQGLGNDIIRLIGGRSVHPVSACIGGFYGAPRKDELVALLSRLKSAQQDVVDLVHWVATLQMPDDEQEFISVCISHDEEYAMNEGRMVSDTGLDIGIDEFDAHFKEFHQPHSTALHCLLDGKPYLVGPLARINNNLDKLPKDTRKLLKDSGIKFPSRSMFHSMLARAVELHFALNEAIRIMHDYQPPEAPNVPVTPQAGVGFGCTEAPRGILWHRYEMDIDGHVVSARIVPPTSQNQARIEEDIGKSLNHYGLDHEDAELQLHAEKVIRNYDPCISCATHFLKLNISREGTAHVKPIKAQLGRHDVLTVIAVGSPLPPDNISWLVVDRLHQESGYFDKHHIELIKLDRPGTELLDYLRRPGPIIVLDAILTDKPHDKLMAIELKQLYDQPYPVSSHGLGLAQALKLGEQLNELQQDVHILGIPVTEDETGVVDDYVTHLKVHIEQYTSH